MIKTQLLLFCIKQKLEKCVEKLVSKKINSIFFSVAKKHQGVMAVARLVFAGHTPDKQNPYSSAQSGGGSYNSNNFYNDRDQYSNSWNRDSKSDTQFESQVEPHIIKLQSSISLFQLLDEVTGE